MLLVLTSLVLAADAPLVAADTSLSPRFELMTRRQLDAEWSRVADERPLITGPLLSVIFGGATFIIGGAVLASFAENRSRPVTFFSQRDEVGFISGTATALGAGAVLLGVWWFTRVLPDFKRLGLQLDAINARREELDRAHREGCPDDVRRPPPVL